MQRVVDLDELTGIVGEPHASVLDKDIGRIDEHARTIIGASPFVLLATSAPDGTCDVSPRGEPPGGVLVLDEHTLALPDRPGNRRTDSLRNILANPHVGLLFLIGGMHETLRVNGTATIVRDAPFFEQMAVRGRQPRLAIVVTVTELYLHCAKAFKRAKLWEPASWPTRDSLPSAGRIFADQMGLPVPAEQLDKSLDEDARTNLF